MKKFKEIQIKPLTKLSDLNHNVVASPPQIMIDIEDEEIRKEWEKFQKHNYQNPTNIQAIKKNNEDYISTPLKSSANRNKIWTFPEPDPICIYYNIANNNLEESYNLKNKDIFNGQNHDTFKNYDIFSEYFGLTAQGIIFLITTIEGFINQFFIEEEYNIEGIKRKKGNLEYAKLGEKINTIIPKLSGVDFAKTNKSEYDRIMNTNDLRDDLIHLKRTNKSNNTAYQDLFKRLYDYNQFKNSEAVYRFLDTLKPNYFEIKK